MIFFFFSNVSEHAKSSQYRNSYSQLVQNSPFGLFFSIMYITPPPLKKRYFFAVTMISVKLDHSVRGESELCANKMIVCSVDMLRHPRGGV